MKLGNICMFFCLAQIGFSSPLMLESVLNSSSPLTLESVLSFSSPLTLESTLSVNQCCNTLAWRASNHHENSRAYSWYPLCFLQLPDVLTMSHGTSASLVCLCAFLTVNPSSVVSRCLSLFGDKKKAYLPYCIISASAFVSVPWDTLVVCCLLCVPAAGNFAACDLQYPLC